MGVRTKPRKAAELGVDPMGPGSHGPTYGARVDSILLSYFIHLTAGERE